MDMAQSYYDLIHCCAIGFIFQ